jgi:taurine dioxygenase
LGAEAYGVDLRDAVSNSPLRAVRRELLRHMVFFFPDQSLSPRAQRDFARNWGSVSPYPRKTDLADVEVSEVARLAAWTGDTADIWHTDGTHRDRAEWLAFLSAVKIPPVGGDTLSGGGMAGRRRLHPPTAAAALRLRRRRPSVRPRAESVLPG